MCIYADGDFQQLARSGPLPYDATPTQLKDALAELTNVEIIEVRRCDEAGDDKNVGLGSFEGWSFGCPHLGQGRGGYTWLIIFDVPMKEQSLPNLQVYRNEILPKNSYSGAGYNHNLKYIHFYINT